MRDLTKKFLSEAEKTNISNAVAQLEKNTTGELVPMIVSTSGSYVEYSIIGALALAMPTAVIKAYFINWWYYYQIDTLLLFFVFFLPLFILFFLILNYMPCFQRLFVPKKVMDEEVRESAAYAFFTNGLHKTKNASGVLLYISVFEKRVWILADNGINSRIPEGTWDSIVAELTAGLKEKQHGKVIVTAVNKIGDILTAHFPSDGDSTNELPDLIVGK